MANNTASNNNTASSLGIKGQQVTADSGNLYTTNTNMTNANNERQLASRFGGSRKKLKGGFVAPVVQISYKETGVGNTNTSNNVTSAATTTANLSAQADLDKQVSPVQKAGKKKSHNKSHKLVGGWPEWGCMSGGRKSRRRRRKKSRKLRKKSYRRRKSK
jgi:hypothetical protein